MKDEEHVGIKGVCGRGETCVSKGGREGREEQGGVWRGKGKGLFFFFPSLHYTR